MKKKKNKAINTNDIANQEERLSEIWRLDIFPHWEEHWDYRSHKPINYKKINEPGFWKSVCSCLSSIYKKNVNLKKKKNIYL
jgi:hypothetical protein